MPHGSTVEKANAVEQTVSARVKSVTTVTVSEPQTSESPEPSGWRLPYPRLVTGLVGAGLLWLCFFPVAWGWLSAVALFPILCLVRSNGRPRNIYFSAWLCGLLFYWPILHWMTVANPLMYYTWALLATYCSLYIPVAVYLIRRLEAKTRLPLVIIAPLVWVGLEFARSFLLTGFHWYFLAYTLHDYLPLIQITDLGGVFLVSLLIVAVNAIVFQWLCRVDAVRRILALGEPRTWIGNLYWQSGVVAFLIVGAFVYGQIRLHETSFTIGPRVALLQGNIGIQDEIEAEGPGKAAAQKRKDIAKHYDPLWMAACKQPDPPQLVVWPETSFPVYWVEDDGTVNIELGGKIGERQNQFRQYTRASGVDTLFGVNRVIVSGRHPDKRFNSALMIRKSGNWDGEGRYDKIHRLPFGEYLPFVDWLPFMQTFSPYESPYSIIAGEEKTRFKMGDYSFGVLICYEDTVHYLAKAYSVAGDDGPPVDFLVNISNEGWFMGTAEHEQHLANARFRAIESRRSVIRAANMGISAVIDSNGRVLKPVKDTESAYNWVVPAQGASALPVAEWGQFKDMAGVFTANVPIDSRTTLYAHVGDWVGWGCLIFILLVIFVNRLPSRWRPTWLVAR